MLVSVGLVGKLAAQRLTAAAAAAASEQVLSPAVHCRGGSAQVKALLAVPLVVANRRCIRMQSHAKRCRQVQVVATVAIIIMVTAVAMMRVVTHLSAAKAVTLLPTVH